MKPETSWRGVFVILPTPFTENGDLDLASLRKVIKFCTDCGAHGLVTTANAGEQPYLTDDENRQVVQTVLENAGSTPVIAGISSTHSRLAVERARFAERNGAAGLMAMPPTVQRGTEPEIKAYYSEIAAASSLPIFIQNYGAAGGTVLSARFIAELAQTVPNVNWVKEETEFSSSMITAITEAGGPAIKGIMGGKAGRHLLDEFRRGVVGTMPACEVTDAHVKLWNALDSGDETRAREIYRLMLPLLMFETGYGTAVYKEVLRRRGVFSSSYFRQTGGRTLDRYALEDLSLILEDMKPLFDERYPVLAN